MRHQGVTAKIWLSIGVFALGYVLSVAFQQVQSQILENKLESASNGLYPAAQKAQGAEAAFQRMTKLYRDAVMTEDTDALDQARAEGEQIVAQVRAITALQGIPEDNIKQAAALAENLAQLSSLSDQTYRGAVASKGNMTPTLAANLKQAADQTNAARQGLEALVKHTADDLRAELAGAVSSSATQRWLALGLFLLTLAVAGVTVHLTIRRSIRNPLTQLTGRLKASSQQISMASQQLSGASDLLARNANEQAAALEEASASSEEANAMARSNAQNAGQARSLMQESAQNFEAIHAAHAQLVSAMEEIGQSSSKIGRIIKAIDEIAFQTNILALNAAVEAARAGEAGRGFAVVADEVRSLAQRSAQAARETADLIEESAGRAGAGQERLEAVTRLLATNSEIAGKVNAIVEEITRASEEQARGIDEISRTVQITSRGTHQTAASASEGAASVQSMTSQVQELNDVVDRLQAMVGA